MTAFADPQPEQKEMWFNVVADNGKPLATINTKTKEIKYFGDKEEVILALYQAFRNLQGLAVSEIEKVEKQCSEKKAQPKKK